MLSLNIDHSGCVSRCVALEMSACGHECGHEHGHGGEHDGVGTRGTCMPPREHSGKMTCVGHMY